MESLWLKEIEVKVQMANCEDEQTCPEIFYTQFVNKTCIIALYQKQLPIEIKKFNSKQNYLQLNYLSLELAIAHGLFTN